MRRAANWPLSSAMAPISAPESLPMASSLTLNGNCGCLRSGQIRVRLAEAVTTDHIAQIVSRWTGIPVDRMLQGEKDKLLQMETAIAHRVIGQHDAVMA